MEEPSVRVKEVRDCGNLDEAVAFIDGAYHANPHHPRLYIGDDPDGVVSVYQACEAPEGKDVPWRVLEYFEKDYTPQRPR